MSKSSKLRRRLQRKRMKSPGLSPGTIQHTGERRLENVRITVFDYDPDRLQERQLASADECAPFERSSTTSWLDIDGLHDTALLARVGAHFGLHPLVVEDIASVGQRPKVEAYDNHLFIVMRQLSWDDANRCIQHEQFSLVLGPRWVLSFQENVGDVLDPVRDRLRSGKGRLRRMGADYLAYALMDAIVDHYFLILEKLGERIQEVEDALFVKPELANMQEMHGLKQEALFLRKSVWPLRDVLGQILRDESPLISAETRVFFRDVYDHTVQVVETIETYRDLIAGLLELYLSNVSNRLNEVMKVLTIVSTIFIPLSFLAGVYGMNFQHMPELRWRYGYPVALGGMVAVGLGMLVYFRHRRWL